MKNVLKLIFLDLGFYVVIIIVCLYALWQCAVSGMEASEECECRYWRTAWDEHPVIVNRKCELIDGYVIAGSDTISPYKVSNVCR
jgi:hypothetical protein